MMTLMGMVQTRHSLMTLGSIRSRVTSLPSLSYILALHQKPLFFETFSAVEGLLVQPYLRMWVAGHAKSPSMAMPGLHEFWVAPARSHTHASPSRSHCILLRRPQLLGVGPTRRFCAVRPLVPAILPA